MSNEVSDLLPGGFAEGLGAAESTAYDLTRFASSRCCRISWQRRPRTLGPPKVPPFPLADGDGSFLVPASVD